MAATNEPTTPTVGRCEAPGVQEPVPVDNESRATDSFQSHPLGPLSAQEILQSSDLVRSCWPGNVDCHFKVVTLLEPAKAELIPYLVAERAGQRPARIDRRAFVVYYLRGTVRGKWGLT